MNTLPAPVTSAKAATGRPHTSRPTRNGPNPGANPFGERLSEEIAAATNTSTKVPMISLKAFDGACRTAGDVQKHARLLAALSVLLAVVITGIVRGRDSEARAIPASAAVLVGLLLAWGSVASAPPPPPVPTKAYETPLDICRPPFRGN